MSDMTERRAALVTGASSGIGRAIAIELGHAGIELWLVGRANAELEATARLVTETGAPDPHYVALDLRQHGRLTELIHQIGATHPHLFAVINNAGLMHPEPIMKGSIKRWQAMLDVNLLAPLEACKAAIEVMRRHGRPGHLINISSLQARFEVPGVYGATKLALEAIGRSLRQELENDDIRISTIIPGGFATQLSRGFLPEQLDQIAKELEARGVGLDRGGMQRLLSDPIHIARVVRYLLEQPIDLNLEEIVIRPAVGIKI